MTIEQLLEVEGQGRDFLEHYGVLGMKWGKRRGSVDDDGVRRGDSEDHAVSRQLKKQPVRTLSNKDLETLNKRLQLERTLLDLETQTATIGRGRKRAKDIIDHVETASKVFNLYNSPMANQVRQMLGKKSQRGQQKLF